ncbi:MAG: prepilin-type N-terminal cleavage/methylation domain-containing protein, partial [bacterium]
MSYRSHEGFTLIEMVVVVAILAILMALLFPVFSKVKEQGVRSSCIYNMRIISQGVMAYHQDHNAFPDMPGKMGLRGIPQGGVTGLNLSAQSIGESNLWCARDTYPERLGRTDISRDQTDSTYQYAYNGYGYVTTYEGLPFPVTTVEAANYFFGNPRVVDPAFESYNLANVNCNWDLGLIEQKNNQPFDVSRGLYQGLWNYRAPSETIVTLCQNHINAAGYPDIIPAVTLGGEALWLRPVRAHASGSGFVTRRPSATNLVPAIDWRINKEAFSDKPEDMNYFGDSLGNNSASTMPIVEVYYRHFTADGDLNKSANDPLNLSGHGFYDTGIDVKPGDYIM